MANMSNATVKFIFKDKGGKVLPIDYTSLAAKEWGDIVVELLAYQSAGAVLENGVYALCGRWAFQTNLGWKDNWQVVFNVFRKKINKKAVTLHGEYADMDLCTDWVGFGNFDLDIKTGELLGHDFFTMTTEEFTKKYLLDSVKLLGSNKEDDTETLEANIMDMADVMIFEGLYHTIS